MGNVCSIQMPSCCAVEANNEIDELISGHEILGMESLLQEVCDYCLSDEQVGILGIHGFYGVGKTTLLTIVYNKFRNRPSDFDVVIWVTVSDAPRLARTQADIWKQIGIYDDQWENKSCDVKATDIFNVLRQKKFLVLLDDVRESFKFENVGVPLQNRENRSKIALTTSLPSTGKVKSEKQIIVGGLTESDGWKLFKKKVGKEVLCRPAFRPIAKKVVNRGCFGHPLLLNVTARLMANQKTAQEWTDTRMNVFPFTPVGGTLINVMHSMLKRNYDHLPSERVKSCLKYCALFPSNFKILKEDLVSYWIYENFWEDCDNGVDVAEGYHIIDTLVDYYFLEDKGNYITMTYFLQVVASFIASRSKEAIRVELDSQRVEALDVGEWEEVERLSLLDCNILNLPEVPVCPNLLTLLLCHNPHLAMIIDGFFQHMNALMVLDLSNTSINELPLGISKLVSLQYLDVSRTWIEELPVEVQSLSRLKCLKLEHNGLLRLIPRQVIASLLKLEILRIFSCGVSLVWSEDNILSCSNEHVDELQGLEHLNTLSITITSSAAFQSLFNVPKSQTCTKALSLKCFWGTTSLNISMLADMKVLEVLEICNIDRLEELKIDFRIKEIEIQEPDSLCSLAVPWERSFNSLQEVTVRKCFHLKELTWVILAPNLKVLIVIDCKEMEEIISIDKLGEVSNVAGEHLIPFLNLEVIALEKLPKLRSIYWSTLPFPCLQKIKVIDCPLLKKLPLNSSSAMDQVVLIHAKEQWWNWINWEDDATRIAFLRGFIEAP